MNITLWILQAILALTSLISGLFKSILPEHRLVQKGQTGVEGLSPAIIKFIGISEILIALGLILPQGFWIAPILTPLAAACFGLIMILGCRVHYQRYIRLGAAREKQNAINNIIILFFCLLVCIARTAELLAIREGLDH